MREAWIAQLLMLFLVPAAFVTGTPQTPAGGFGETLEQAKQTGFFKWFMLAQTAESTDSGAKQITFQPTGDQFHNLTHVNVKVDAQGHIVAIELVLSREFVDSSSVGIFARDIAKSFVQTGVNPQDQENVVNLVREIDQPQGSSAPIILHQDAVKPPPSGPPSQGYLVYLGKRDAFQIALPHGQILNMENKAPDKKTAEDQKTAGKVLSLSFRAKP